MAETRVQASEQDQTRIKNVPIAVTPEGFWCCPSPVAFQKTLKAHNALNKAKSAPQTYKPSPHNKTQSLQLPEKKPIFTQSNEENPGTDPPPEISDRKTREKSGTLPRKVSIEFGEPNTSDLKVVLVGKQGFSVRMSVHRNVLVECSGFFADKLLGHELGVPSLKIDDCEDAEIYVETVGLMYCKDLKQRLIKQNVLRVLRILKVAEQLGFNTCIQSCLEYLEAAPWVGDEEEDKVVSSVLRLQSEGIGVTPVLKRVSSNIPNPPKDTISHVLQLVLNSNEDKGRREMKSIVLKLLRENNYLPSSSGVSDLCNDTVYESCKICLGTLLSLFKQASDPEFTGIKDAVVKQIAFEADNLTWLLDILADRRAADEFSILWASQQELAVLHSKLPIVNRHLVSCVTARVFVGIGRGEILPSKDTRLLLLKTWLEPLINDYSWLQHACRSFDRKVVEEGIGQTILTLPLEDQQSILLSWLGSFLKVGDNCPNLLRAFEVWWRRTFIRPYVEDEQG